MRDIGGYRAQRGYRAQLCYVKLCYVVIALAGAVYALTGPLVAASGRLQKRA